MHTLHKTNNGKQQAEKEKQQKKAKMPVINNGKPRKNIVLVNLLPINIILAIRIDSDISLKH